MPLAITVDREAVDLAVSFLQSASVSRVRVAATGSVSGQVVLSDPAAVVAKVSLPSSSGSVTAGTCDMSLSALRKVLDAVPSYVTSVTLAVTPSVQVQTGPSTYTSSAAEIRVLFGSSAVAIYDSTISAVA